MVNKRGPEDLGPQAVLAPGQPTGAAGTSRIKQQPTAPMIQAARAAPWTGTTDDAVKAVLSRMDDGKSSPGLLANLKKRSYEFYLEMIEPNHPLRKLAEAIEKGGPIPDAYDPRFLNRLAEHANY